MKDPFGAALDGGGKNESIPESDVRLILDSKCISDFSRRGIDTPSSVGAHNKSGRFFGKGMRNLPCDVHVEFLKNLHLSTPVRSCQSLWRILFAASFFALASTSWA